MKDTFPGYYQPSKQEFTKLWEESLFVFDANVLLNLYRYSNETRDEILKILTKISERIWIPYQTAFEYHKRRLDVIAQQEKTYDDIINLIVKTQEELENQLLSNMHPFIKDAEQHMEKAKNIFKELDNKLREQKEEWIKLTQDDHIKESITNLFNDKVGKSFSQEKLNELYNEGNKRYNENIPPGYEDAKNKKGNDKFGDLILWFQTLEKAKESNKSIIFITDEKKADWWLIFKGKIISPRPELVEEMQFKANVSFYMYRVDPFLEHARKYYKQKIKQKAIDEVRNIRKLDEEVLKRQIELAKTFQDAVHHTELMKESNLSAKIILDAAKQMELMKDSNILQQAIQEANRQIQMMKESNISETIKQISDRIDLMRNYELINALKQHQDFIDRLREYHNHKESEESKSSEKDIDDSEKQD